MNLGPARAAATTTIARRPPVGQRQRSGESARARRAHTHTHMHEHTSARARWRVNNQLQINHCSVLTLNKTKIKFEQRLAVRLTGRPAGQRRWSVALAAASPRANDAADG